MPLAVIVSGPPGAGKTTLGERIAHELSLPFISKDRIKELLFETLGVGDRTWSQKLGAATMQILFMLADIELAAGRSFMLEANFRPAQANGQFRFLKEKYSFQTFQVECTANTEVLMARYRTRAESGQRHPGHLDSIIYAEVESDLKRGAYGPLKVADTLFVVDTTDVAKVDYERLLGEIKSAQDVT